MKIDRLLGKSIMIIMRRRRKKKERKKERKKLMNAKLKKKRFKEEKGKKKYNENKDECIEKRNKMKSGQGLPNAIRETDSHWVYHNYGLLPNKANLRY